MSWQLGNLGSNSKKVSQGSQIIYVHLEERLCPEGPAQRKIHKSTNSLPDLLQDVTLSWHPDTPNKRCKQEIRKRRKEEIDGFRILVTRLLEGHWWCTKGKGKVNRCCRQASTMSRRLPFNVSFVTSSSPCCSLMSSSISLVSSRPWGRQGNHSNLSSLCYTF